MMPSQQKPIDKYLLEKIVNEGDSEHLQYYLMSLFEAVCQCIPYHTQKLTWKGLQDVIVNGASGSFWGFKWNIYTAYLITYVFDKGDRRYRFVLDNTLKDFPDSTGKLVKSNTYKIQESLSDMLSNQEGDYTLVYPINTDWEICHPASTVFNVKKSCTNEFMRDYKTYIMTIKMAHKMFILGAQGKIAKLAKEVGDQPIFGSPSFDITEQQLHKRRALMKRLFSKLIYSQISYEHNYLLPLYGLNI